MGDLYLGKIWKRIIASVLDYVVVFALAITFFMFISTGMVDIGFHNSFYKQEQFRLQDESHLFDVSEENGVYTQVNIIEFNEKEVDFAKFLVAINDFYYDYLDSSNKNNETLNKEYFLFDEDSLENSIFKINSLDASYADFVLKETVVDVATNNEYKKGEEGYDQAIKNYFIDENKGVYNLALSTFTNSQEFVSISNQIIFIERVEIMLCMLVASLIVFPLPILINKNGESIFMHFLKLGYATRNGYKVRLGHKLIRIFVLCVLNTISVYLYLTPFLINIILFFVTREKRSLVDLSSGEVCVDLTTSTIYVDYEEMEKDKK